MSRKIAFDILREVLIHKQYANVSLKRVDHPSIALITQLVYGTLQQYDFCLFQWQDNIKSPLKKDIEILINFSVYQHIFVDKLPDYAIVDEANNLSKKLFGGRYQKLVNAVLRKSFKQEIKQVDESSIENIARKYSFQPWIIEMWVKQYGRDMALDFAISSNQRSQIYVKENPFSNDTYNLFEMKETDVEGCTIVDRTFLASESFKHGKYIIQDKNAQQVSHFVDVKPNDRVLDACSAPGGKSVSMAIKMKNQGEIVAIDLYDHRIELIHNLIEKTNISIIKPMQLDATQAHHHFEEKSFDGVLVDAPCSGLGVLKRKPEIKHFLQGEDIDQLVLLQQQILTSVSSLVKKDGWIVYSTCTLNKKENEKQAEWFEKQFPNFTKLDEKFLNPRTTDADGFYMVKFVRIR